MKWNIVFRKQMKYGIMNYELVDCVITGGYGMDTGEVIRYLRKRDNLTQQELADMLGVKKSSVQKYESGSVQNLKLETIQKLCEIFQVAPYSFVYPNVWKEYEKFYEGDSNLHKMKALYTVLTKEARDKTLVYMEDLGQVKQYVRKDADAYKELEKLFPWRKRTPEG